MEYTLTTSDRRRDAAVIQHVSLDQLQPLAGTFQRQEMSILAITYNALAPEIITNIICYDPLAPIITSIQVCKNLSLTAMARGSYTSSSDAIETNFVEMY
jgi:hypothetical protein